MRKITPVSRRLPGTSPDLGRANHVRRLRVLLGALILAIAVPADAATISSPLRYPSRAGLAAERAAEAGEWLLDLDARAFAELRDVGPKESVRLERFPFAPGATGDLLLHRFEVAAPDAKIVVETASGETFAPFPRVTHLRGSLDGQPDSRVYVAVHGSFLIANLRTSAGLVYVGPDGAVQGPVQHVLRSADSPLNAGLAPAGWKCDADELPLAPPDHPRSGRSGDEPVRSPSGAVATLSALATTASKDATVSIETDQELLAKFGGNVGSMSAYITTLLGQISTIYDRDVSVHLTVNMIQAWTTTDPYSSPSPRTQLDEVGDWWHANRPKTSYPRTIVTYLSGKPVTGGIAWLNVLCMNDFSQGGHWGGAYSVVQLSGNYPSNLWDLIATAHEMGHNFGSPHTHCFSPPIDMCYNGESGCYSGSIVNPGPLGGTIMSYCHLLSGGFGNIDLRFHERCINEEMLPEINSVGCLTTIPDPDPTATSYYTLTPCRVVDTRNPNGPYGGPALTANGDRTFVLGGRCGIPMSAKAAAVNVAVTGATALGGLRLYPAGATLPLATAINYRAWQARANSAVAPLSSSGGIAVHCDQASGTAQVIIDVLGYYQ
jgi:hypothetical protein